MSEWPDPPPPPHLRRSGIPALHRQTMERGRPLGEAYSQHCGWSEPRRVRRVAATTPDCRPLIPERPTEFLFSPPRAQRVGLQSATAHPYTTTEKRLIRSVFFQSDWPAATANAEHLWLRYRRPRAHSPSSNRRPYSELPEKARHWLHSIPSGS